jgi:hypothetical protein
LIGGILSVLLVLVMHYARKLEVNWLMLESVNYV